MGSKLDPIGPNDHYHKRNIISKKHARIENTNNFIRIKNFKNDQKNDQNDQKNDRQAYNSFKCHKCNKIYANKSNLTRHLRHYCKGEIIKTKYIEEVQLEMINFTCGYCSKTFTTKKNLTRHLKYRCKIKQEDDFKKEQIYRTLLLKMEQQNKEMKIMKIKIDTLQNDKIANITNNTNTANSHNIINNNSNNINIKVVAFGKEDKDVLTDNEIFRILKRGFYSVPELIKAIHFNKDRPENHNVYISNMRDKYVMVFDGDRWKLANKHDTIDNMFDQ
jgi:uncharacterized C2H2 Zn-finger protein